MHIFTEKNYDTTGLFWDKCLTEVDKYLLRCAVIGMSSGYPPAPAESSLCRIYIVLMITVELTEIPVRIYNRTKPYTAL